MTAAKIVPIGTVVDGKAGGHPFFPDNAYGIICYIEEGFDPRDTRYHVAPYHRNLASATTETCILLDRDEFTVPRRRKGETHDAR